MTAHRSHQGFTRRFGLRDAEIRFQSRLYALVSIFSQCGRNRPLCSRGLGRVPITWCWFATCWASYLLAKSYAARKPCRVAKVTRTAAHLTRWGARPTLTTFSLFGGLTLNVDHQESPACCCFFTCHNDDFPRLEAFPGRRPEAADHPGGAALLRWAERFGVRGWQ